MFDWRDVLPYGVFILIFGWGWLAMQRRSDTLDHEQDHWRQVLQAERDNAVRECRRWQRYALDRDRAYKLLWREWVEWGQTMIDLVMAGGLKPGTRIPLMPDEASVNWPSPPNGEEKQR